MGNRLKGSILKVAGKQIFVPFEHNEQVAVFEWSKLNEARWPCLKFMYAVPNGARVSSQSQANRLHREGMKAGVCDICLPFPNGGFHGAYFEMKRRHNGKVSKEQAEYMEYLVSVGYYVGLMKGADQCINGLRNYLIGNYQKDENHAV